MAMIIGFPPLSSFIHAATHLKTVWMCTSLYCTSSQWISCKMKSCILGMAINFQAAPIVMKLNFNYSFQGSYGWSPSTLKIICLFVNLEVGGGGHSGECEHFLWQSDNNYVWGRSQAQHGPMSLTCSPPQTERGWGVVIIFYYSERNTNPNEHR